ncbi:MAG: hypothetical protein WC903_08515 [Candidatus Margulisiibacteriota bacterium]
MKLLKKNGFLEKLSGEEFYEKYNTLMDTFFKNYPSDSNTQNINVRLQFYQNEFLRRETGKAVFISQLISVIAIVVAVIVGTYATLHK